MSCSGQKPNVVYRLPLYLNGIERVAYSCQTWLAWAVTQHYRNRGDDRYYAWFATELNPESVDLSSRPLRIYEELDAAVKKGNVNNPRISKIRAGLSRGVEWKRGDSVITEDEAAELRRRIADAGIEWFRPQIRKIDVGELDLKDCRRRAKEQGGHLADDCDEYLCEAISSSRVAVIVE